MRKRLLAALLISFLLTPLAGGAGRASLPAPNVVRVSVAPGAPLGTLVGLGVEFDPYERKPAPRRWKQILARLASMRPGFLRVMSGAGDYCSGFDAQGQPVFRWTTDPQAPQLQRVYDVLDFAQAHGIPVYLGEWSPPGQLGIHSPGDPRWPAMISAFVGYLIRERHYTVIHNYIFMNEPNGAWMWRGSTPDFAAWAAGEKVLRADLDAAGLQSVALAGPDNSGDPAWFARSASELHGVFGAWEQHIYATDEQVNSGSLETMLRRDGALLAADDPLSVGKPRFIAESGLVTGKNEELDQQPRVRDFDYGVTMSDYIVQVARAGWGGADAWDLDDAMHGNGHGGLKIWGFWDSSTDAGMEPRPWFYAWSMLSRAMPAGASIVPVEMSSSSSVRATAVRWGTDAVPGWSLILVNTARQPVRVRVALPAGPTYRAYRYFQEDRLTDASGSLRGTEVKPHHGDTVIDLPSRGVAVYTSAR